MHTRQTMSDLQRREFIRAAGAGAGLALGTGAASAQQGTGGESTATSEQAVAAEFTGTASSGFIIINGASPEDTNPGVEVSIGDLDSSIVINGEVYEDKTWSSNDVTFPDVDPSTLIDADSIDIVESITFDQEASQIAVIVNSISGTYDPQQGLVIGDIDILFDVFVTGFAVESIFGSEIDFTFEFEIDVNNGQTIELTTETSNGEGTEAGLTGSTANLLGQNTSATVVSNNFTVPEAVPPENSNNDGIEKCVVGQCINVNDELNLPSTPGGRNWLQIDLDLDWADGPPDIGPSELPGGSSPPKDPDGDGAVEDITGTGEVTVMDTQTLFENLDSQEVQENAEFFNFSSNSDDGEVSILDVASHWVQYVKNG